ncbi:MAG: PhoU domain-containing protein, partial [Candidatus Omnitrophota bacterium]
MDNSILLKKGIFEMIAQSHKMFQTTFEGFMENDLDTLNRAVKEEQGLTETYVKLTSYIVASSKNKLSKKEKKILLGLLDIISGIERIGDCC